MLLIVPDYKLWFASPSIGILYIASTLRNIGEEVVLLDAHFEKDFYHALDREIKNHTIVGLTGNITHAASAREIASYIRGKYPEITIVWGGPYASVGYMKLFPDLADIIVIGEGETQIIDICKGRKLSDIAGIAYWDGVKVVTNPRECYIEDLDSLPFPAWDLIDSGNFTFPGKRPQALIMTQRGCPYQCINCTKFIHGDRYRTRSVNNIMDEIEYLAESKNCKSLYIWDDNFTLYPQRVKEICSEIKERGLDYIQYAIPAGIRADILDEEMYFAMRDAGFYYVNVAVESGDQAVIEGLGKRLDLKRVPLVLDILAKADFRVGLFFMMGLPFDTHKSLQKSVDFASSLKAHHAYFFNVTPLPGTELYNMLASSTELLRNYDEEVINYDNVKNRFINPELSSRDVRRYIKKAYRSFYTPSRITKTLAKIYYDGNLVSDISFFISSGINIMFKGHR